MRPLVALGLAALSIGRAVGNLFALPIPPASNVFGVVRGLTFPPQLLGFGVVSDVGEERLRAFFDGVHGGGIRLPVGVLCHAERAVFGVHAVNLAVFANVQPHDVIAVEVNFVAVTQGVRS